MTKEGENQADPTWHGNELTRTREFQHCGTIKEILATIKDPEN